MLIGLGLGPGDPELLTLRAVRILKEADRVYVPGKLAYDLVAPYCEAEILDFPMTSDESRIRSCMEENSRKIAPVARDGTAVLGLIGDPNIYSTFSRLCDVTAGLYPEIEYKSEPGISSITAFTSAAGIHLSGGFIVSDGGELESKVLLKVRRPADTVSRLKKEGYSHFVLVERMYMEGEKVFRDWDIPETSNYFSILFARR